MRVQFRDLANSWQTLQQVGDALLSLVHFRCSVFFFAFLNTEKRIASRICKQVIPLSEYTRFSSVTFP